MGRGDAPLLLSFRSFRHTRPEAAAGLRGGEWMRRVGLILLVIGLAGFLFASAQRTRYEKAASTADPSHASSPTEIQKIRRSSEAWETARWMILGAAVMGLVFTVLPGKES